MTEKQRDEREGTIKKLVDLVRLRRMALSTERTYAQWSRSYIDWLAKHGSRFPDSKARMEGYLTALAHRGCAASTQNQAFNALLFLYEEVRKELLPEIRALRAKQPRHYRTAISKPQTLALLDAVPNVAGYPTKLVARLLYGCGLRVSEPLNLRVKDVDVTGSILRIRGAKGGKDRVVPVPCGLMSELVAQMKKARVVWEADQHRNMPVEVPGELARKYPKAPFALQWSWVFPSHHPCNHPRTGERVRYRMHEANVQRAVKLAARTLELDSMVTPHTLRHCCATHILQAGGNVRDLQAFLGHASIETTQGYIHPEAMRVVSPLA